MPSPIPSLFDIPCSTASQRAYSNINSEVERSFLKLQTEDGGRVEHRTIVSTPFSTHLTISRWEPVHALPTTTAAPVPILASAPVNKVVAEASRRRELDSTRSDNTCGIKNRTLQFQADNNNNSNSHRGPHSPSSPQTSPPSLKHHAYQQQQSQLRQPQEQPQRNDQIYAARLMSLANYIRHIISLSSGNSPLHSQLALAQQHQQQQQQGHWQRKGHDLKPVSYTSAPYLVNAAGSGNRGSGRALQDHSSASLPSPLSAGPGPIKSTMLSTRRNRHTSEYDGHQTRRHMHHQQQQQQLQGQQSSHVHLNISSFPSSSTHLLPSPTSPTSYADHQPSYQHQQLQSPQRTARTFSPLLKVPYANLTLTLALIYVDRLKTKYPEAKGEAGCSHRLFLVAYIIAAKYRCSVELAARLQEHNRNAVPEYDDSTNSGIDSSASSSFSGATGPSSFSAAGSSAGPSFGTAAESGVAPSKTTTTARTSPTQPMVRPRSGSVSTSGKPEPKSLPIQSTPFSTTDHRDDASPASRLEETRGYGGGSPMITTTTANHNSVVEGGMQNASRSVGEGTMMLTPVTPSSSSALSTSSGSTPSTPSTSSVSSVAAAVAANSSILQVEDLDRMETEFLTFLDFDLLTRSQDLDTCWGLLVGNKEF
ncbi:hypothetical protein BGZ98_003940 [Dissophora globulifera]|nr:hypothetical protein BGZ98_003940 [Dissophora globulifera]